MLRGKSASGTEIVLSEEFVADKVGESVDKLKTLAAMLGSIRQREAANVAAGIAEWLDSYARKLDPTHAARKKSQHATALERMMQD